MFFKHHWKHEEKWVQFLTWVFFQTKPVVNDKTPSNENLSTCVDLTIRFTFLMDIS